MEITKFVKAAGIVALFAGSSAFAAPANLISNGDFQSYSVFVPDGGYTMVSNGSNAITDWTVGANSVDLIKNSYGSINGTSIDMLGSPGPGALSQQFNVSANTTYNLSFDLSRNPYASNGANVAVNFGNSTAGFSSTGTGIVDHYSMSFTTGANIGTGKSLLSFASVGGDGWSGAVLDNVRVSSAVPEPESYAMLLAGLGLMGFVARRKKSA